MRARLRARIVSASNAFAPALTVVGWRGIFDDVIAESRHPPEAAIMGFTLPARYDAIGLIAEAVIARPPARRREPAALGIVASRQGTISAFLAPAGREVIDTDQPQGWLIDACQRALGRATAPTELPAVALPTALWLDRVMVALVSPSAEPLAWARAVELSPVPSRWRSLDPGELGATLGSTARSWRSLRRAAARSAALPITVPPLWARWMDDSMFARWCVGAFPDLGSLRADVEFLAPPPVAEAIAIALDAAWSASAE